MCMMYTISYCMSSCFVHRPFTHHSTRLSISLRIPARATATWPQILSIFSRSSKGAKALRESKQGQKSPNFIGKVVGYLQLNVRRDTGSACAQVLILSASPNSVFPHMISVRTANHTLKKDLQLQWDPGLHRLRTGHTCCRSRQIQGHLGQLS